MRRPVLARVRFDEERFFARLDATLDAKLTAALDALQSRIGEQLEQRLAHALHERETKPTDESRIAQLEARIEAAVADATGACEKARQRASGLHWCVCGTP